MSSVIGGVDLVSIVPLQATGTNRSTKATTTAANAMSTNTARIGWKIKNDDSTPAWINFLGTATATPGGGNMMVAAGGGYLSSEDRYVETGPMSVVTASGTANLTIVEF